jgi:hypothetical protein
MMSVHAPSPLMIVRSPNRLRDRIGVVRSVVVSMIGMRKKFRSWTSCGGKDLLG